MTNDNNSKQDVYTRITNQIIAALEQGVKPWTQPWSAAHAAGHVSRPLRHNGQPYAGINVLTLWASAMERHYAAPIWMTFKQALELGGHVRKGEKGSPVVYANTIVRTEEGADGADEERAIPFLKAYTVFNVEQTEGLPAHYYARAEAQKNPDERIAHAEQFFAATRADIRHGGDSAYYSPVLDYIQMPLFEAFRDAQSYCATLCHETVHWTKAKSRLDRDFGRKKFADEGYAREELVAELGAAFLCADLGLKLEDREDHAAYIGHWLQVLKDDRRAIFTAAAHAQRAADYLHGLQPNAVPAEAEAA
jgi:antirestriction protein ArdC